MLLGVLEKRFKEAKFDGWQGYALLDLPDGEDPRNDCFERLKATLDIVPVALRDRADRFLEINAAWFDEVLKDLCENVGWDFFPENAGAFVVALIDKLKNSSPETTWGWRAAPPSREELGFFDPYGSSGCNPILYSEPKNYAGSALELYDERCIGSTTASSGSLPDNGSVVVAGADVAEMVDGRIARLTVGPLIDENADAPRAAGDRP
ncbi:hypothetical protein [Tardiphaga robiniae]|uniref:Uncharacterized protein n=1 Tax=Tardiphaga robiniae TaxID=943830 RepID=A0A7G6TWK8_9BRAD|nr:hypothetical protein [Tardiphaga robiniae]QND71140.1 hypothetical protein HB776_07720 [Tardiphaga robiniae]